MRRRRLTVTPVNQNMVVVTGWGSRELLTELRGRPPMWSSRPRGWAIHPTTLADLEALAEHHDFDVVHEAGGDAA